MLSELWAKAITVRASQVCTVKCSCERHTQTALLHADGQQYVQCLEYYRLQRLVLVVQRTDQWLLALGRQGKGNLF